MMFTPGLKSPRKYTTYTSCIISTCLSVHCSLPHLYGNSLMSKNPEIPKPSEWGWEWNNRTITWVPYWTDLPDASHMDARYYCIVVARSHARATAKASEPEFDVVSCASVMEAVQTMLSTWSWTVNRMYQELFLVFRIFPNLKRISSCSLYFAS